MMKLMPWNLYDVSVQQAWLEDQAAAVLSARYELFLGNETASMVFWEPELHGLEGQLRIITELLDEVPPGA